MKTKKLKKLSNSKEIKKLNALRMMQTAYPKFFKIIIEPGTTEQK